MNSSNIGCLNTVSSRVNEDESVKQKNLELFPKQNDNNEGEASFGYMRSRRNSYDMSGEDFEVSKAMSPKKFDEYYQNKYKCHDSDKTNSAKEGKFSGNEHNDWSWFDYNPDLTLNSPLNSLENRFKKKDSMNSDQQSTDGSYPEGNTR